MLLLINHRSILVQSGMNFPWSVRKFLGSIRSQRDADARFVADSQEPFSVMTGRAYKKTIGVRAFVGYIPCIVRKLLQDKIRRCRGDLQTCGR